jgi:transposase
MVTIGIDPHKDTHWAVAVDEVGRQLADRKARAVSDGFGEMLAWARGLDDDRVSIVEDCRHVSGPLERFLIEHGEKVARLAPHLMAEARSTVASAGSRTPIDALAVGERRSRKASRIYPQRSWPGSSSRSGCCTAITSASLVNAPP